MDTGFSRLSALLELVRWMGRGLRGDGSSPLRLMELCMTCVDLGVPMEHVSAGLAVLERVAGEFGFGTDTLGATLPSAMAYRRELEETNRGRLAAVAEVARELGPQERPPLLLGDFSSLLEVFGSLGAHPSRVVILGVAGSGGREESVTRRLMSAAPSEVSVAPEGRLAGVAGRYSRVESLGDADFRLPTGPLLVVLLAARLGDPMANPASPAWLQLAVALKAWRDGLDIGEVLALAGEVGLEGPVHHGLAIVSSIFPEFGRLVPVKELNLSAMERRVAVPLAARKVVAYSLEGEL